MSIFSLDQIKSNRRVSSRGFTLFFAMLIGSLMLSIGLAIFNISSKELALSTAGRESQFAFYAADSGVECALYADLQFNAFPRNEESEISKEEVRCNEQNIRDVGTNEWKVVNGATSMTTTFTFFMDPAKKEGPCALVTVTKEENVETRIESRGQNACDGKAVLRVERGIRVQY